MIKNMVSKKMINQMAEEKLDIERKDNEIMITTVGRLVKQKGIDQAIEVCKMLVDKGYPIKWYVVGGGEEEGSLNKKIVENQLQDNFILVGPQKNPYKWMKNCDIYVTTSRFEGYAVTMLEAKALAKPIVATDINEFKEQIVDGENGYLAKDNEMMYNKIVEMIENKNGIKERFIQNLEKDESIENKEELEKLYGIIDE